LEKFVEKGGKDGFEHGASPSRDEVGSVEEESDSGRARCQEVLSQEEQGSGQASQEGAPGDSQDSKGSEGRDTEPGKEEQRKQEQEKEEREEVVSPLKKAIPELERMKEVRCPGCSGSLFTLPVIYSIRADKSGATWFKELGRKVNDLTCYCCGKPVGIDFGESDGKEKETSPVQGLVKGDKTSV